MSVVGLTQFNLREVTRPEWLPKDLSVTSRRFGGQVRNSYVDLISTVDPLDRTIRLTERCYAYHILVRHPELDTPREIEKAVQLADYIAQDSADNRRTVYYKIYRRKH
jgi:hypothetical protein